MSVRNPPPDVDFEAIAFSALAIAQTAELLPAHWQEGAKLQPVLVRAMVEGMRSWAFKIWCRINDAMEANAAGNECPSGLCKPAGEHDAYEVAILGIKMVKLTSLGSGTHGAVSLLPLWQRLSRLVRYAQILNHDWAELDPGARGRAIESALLLHAGLMDIIERL